MDLPTAEFLLECADALELASIDGTDRDAHFAKIAKLVTSTQPSADAKVLLQEAGTKMRELSRMTSLQIAVQPDTQARVIASQLRALIPRDLARPYIYHGTVHGRLASIAAVGLVPAFKPVWKEGAHVEAHAKTAVFFTESWRSAVTWAEVAHFRSRGRRSSVARRPVVIRVSSDGLAIERDVVATAPGCLLVLGTVPAASAHVFVSMRGYPDWINIHKAIGATDELLDC
jgi:hypothetical protein